MNNKKTTEKYKIIDFARKLYFEIDDKGNRIYSLQEICKKIEHKFNKTLSRTTLLNWSKKHSWEIILQQGKIEGIAEAIKDKDDKETAIKDEVAKKYSAYRGLSEGGLVSARYIINKELQIVNEYIKLIETNINNNLQAGNITQIQAITQKLKLVEKVTKIANQFNLNAIASCSLDHVLKLDGVLKESKKTDEVIEVRLVD